MIISRSPLRITLGGGGTDLRSYYSEHEGFLLAGSIDSYVYVMVSKPFSDEIVLKYSEIERVGSIDKIKHPIIRHVLDCANLERPRIEIATVADVPGGTGLGSSGSFTTALLKAVYNYQKRQLHPFELAELACTIEIDRLGEPIGKQDQYAAAIGGVTAYKFKRDGAVETVPVPMDEETFFELEERLLLFYTGNSRRASDLLEDQNQKTKNKEVSMLENLHYVKQIGRESFDALTNGNLAKFAVLMDEHWEIKRSRTPGMTSSEIDSFYKRAKANGALGGKLVGAGGGGFLLLFAEDKARLRRVMVELGLKELRFRFVSEGTSIVSHV